MSENVLTEIAKIYKSHHGMILGEEVYEVEDDEDEEFETLDSIGDDDDGKWLKDNVRPRGIWGK